MNYVYKSCRRLSKISEQILALTLIASIKSQPKIQATLSVLRLSSKFGKIFDNLSYNVLLKSQYSGHWVKTCSSFSISV